jgi:hypothetical protein
MNLLDIWIITVFENKRKSEIEKINVQSSNQSTPTTRGTSPIQSILITVVTRVRLANQGIALEEW